ncbi:MAG: hypothetical protein GXO22_06155 [Aquificae bacterium]|nr:hypothetical protein [Aquificota bacterium]
MKKTKFYRYTQYAFLNVLGNFINPISFVILILFAVAISWIPDGIVNLLSLKLNKEQLYLVQLFGGIFILTILFILGYFYTRQSLSKVEIYEKSPEKRENLILFLSPKNKDISNIKSYKDVVEIKPNWQMPIEAIKYHLPKLKNVFVILSNESKKDFKEFENFVKTIFPDANLNIVPIGLDQNIDFEKMENLGKILEETYKLIKSKYKARDKDIIIDITGGQKLVSIIGAIQTFTHDREFEYVSTSDLKVKSFDIRPVPYGE